MTPEVRTSAFRPERLIDRKVVSGGMVARLLKGGKVLSFWQILEGFGIKVRDVADEIAYMSNIRSQAEKGEALTFDRNTSFRLRLVDLVEEGVRNKTLSRARDPQSGRDGVRYFLSCEKETLLSQGILERTGRTPEPGEPEPEGKSGLLLIYTDI